ncbi:DEAD/DEAH box helicase [Actibacterium pelagium]|uniref:DEAD/DEAH box helicase n=1 Tax=Actibacterium pelagium TaxID=2029103 RepID=A0A917AC04_9RHOB|nr:DEAD/DEAH box helicase [Actibacterium pelagium]GGE39099.1 DEAD/DEAH box helicase [Actibacterium pelagium]
MKQTLAAALEERGYDTLTPVQQLVIDPDLTGQDLLVSAQTGSGKTLGFGLAIAPTILGDADHFEQAAAPLALVIAPTRELALQVKRELGWLYAKAGAFVASCVGGMDMRDERRALARGAHIVVATPGRLRDHIMRGSIDLENIRAVVLDEADEMLDLGFREDLEFILSESPEDRQTLMFSATVPKSIATLAQNYQRDAQRIVAKSEAKQHADIEYRAMMVSDRDVEKAVINTLRFYEAPNAIVFANTRATVNRLTTRLSNRGFQVVALSGELSQAERSHALQAMRDGRAQVCVATDVAARGIDLPNLDLVVHAELPGSHETLLHRSGRTGRAGRKGVSALIVTNKSRRKADRILGMAKVRAEWGNPPSAEEVAARDEERMLAHPDWTTPATEAEQPQIDKLTEAFTPEQIAAAYLRLRGTIRSAPEEISAAPERGERDRPRPREEFGKSVWFSISGGRDAGAEPRRLLPAICKAGDLTKDDIGAIRIRQDMSYVQILETSVPTFLAALGGDMRIEGKGEVTQLAEAPDLPPEDNRPKRFGNKPGFKKDGPRDGYKGKRRDDDRGPKGKPKWDSDSAKAPRKPKRDDAPKRDWKDDAPKKKWDSDAPAKKPKAKWDSDKPARKQKHKGQRDPEIAAGVSERKGKYGAKDGSEAPRRRGPDAAPGRSKPKGPPPPKGKPNSKKNKARAMAAAKERQDAKRKRR